MIENPTLNTDDSESLYADIQIKLGLITNANAHFRKLFMADANANI